MAIQIPQVKRNAPQGAESVGRMDIQAPDAKPYLQNLQTVQKTLESGAELAFKYQKQAQDNNVRELATQYKMKLYGDGTEGDDTWTVNKFQRTPKEGQDFTPYYGSYNDYRTKLREEVLSHPNVSDAIRGRLEQEITETDFYANRTVNIEYLKANNSRTEKIHEAEFNTIMRNDLPRALSNYDSKDLSTVEEFDNVLEKLVNNRKTYYEKSLQMDPNDKVLLEKTREVKAKAVVIAASDALSVGDTQKAEAIYENYKDLIPAGESVEFKAKLNKTLEEEKIKTYVAKYAAFDEATGEKKILEEVPEKDQEEVLKRFVSLQTKKSIQNNRIANQAENLLKVKIQQKAEQGTPYSTVQELENDNQDLVKLVKLNANGWQSAKNMIGVRNKAGDPKKYYELLETWNKGEMKNWDFDQLEKEGVTLSPTEWSKITRKWERKADWTSDRQRLLREVKQTVDVYITDANGKVDILAWNDVIEPWLMQEIEKLPAEFSGASELQRLAKPLKLKVVDMIKKKTQFKIDPVVVPPPKTVTTPVRPVQNLNDSQVNDLFQSDIGE